MKTNKELNFYWHLPAASDRMCTQMEEGSQLISLDPVASDTVRISSKETHNRHKYSPQFALVPSARHRRRRRLRLM